MPNELEPTAEPLTHEPSAGGAPEADDTSLADHEAEFGNAPRRPAAEPASDPEDDARRPPPRDAKTGKFEKGSPQRHRAKSQEASAGDVPRIAELTRRLRETEAERDALKTAPAAPSRPPAPAAAPTVASAKPEEASAKRPVLTDFDDIFVFNEALVDWKLAEARREDRETRQREAESTRVSTAWKEKVAGAKARYPDFDQVALIAPTRIPQGSLIDAWILEHRSGADVLYSLQSNPAELDRILALPIFDQVEALTLLGQRMVPTREPAVRTGAAATTRASAAPRPPTPVRTSAMPAADEPPGDDASLAEHEKFYGPRRRR